MFRIYVSFILACFNRAGYLKLNKALDLIGYLQSETHTVPLLKGLGYLELFYRIIEKRNEIVLTKKLGVSSQQCCFNLHSISTLL